MSYQIKKHSRRQISGTPFHKIDKGVKTAQASLITDKDCEAFIDAHKKQLMNQQSIR